MIMCCPVNVAIAVSRMKTTLPLNKIATKTETLYQKGQN